MYLQICISALLEGIYILLCLGKYICQTTAMFALNYKLLPSLFVPLVPALGCIQKSLKTCYNSLLVQTHC